MSEQRTFFDEELAHDLACKRGQDHPQLTAVPEWSETSFFVEAIYPAAVTMTEDCHPASVTISITETEIATPQDATLIYQFPLHGG